MLKRGFSLIAILLLVLVIAGCNNSRDEQISESDCDPIYFFIKEKSVNTTVENVDTAYDVLISITPSGLRNTSKAYMAYRNSTVSDVVYGDIWLYEKRSIKAYSLKDKVAVDEKGEVYEKLKPCG